MSQSGISVRYESIDKTVHIPIHGLQKNELVVVHGSRTPENMQNKVLTDPSNDITAKGLWLGNTAVSIPSCPGSGYTLESVTDQSGHITLRWAKAQGDLVKDSLRLQGNVEADLLKRNAELVTRINHLTETLNRLSEELKTAQETIQNHAKIQSDLVDRLGPIGRPESGDTSDKLNVKTAKKIISESVPYIDDDGNIIVPSDVSTVVGALVALADSKHNK